MANPIDNFRNFFAVWLNRQENLLEQLLLVVAPETARNTAQHMNLIEQVSSHYKLYYEEKQNAAKEDPFPFLHPTWLSDFERTLLWHGDFKPSIIFRLIDSSVTDLAPEQSERILRLKVETRREERELTDTMARIQESLASPPILNLARQFVRLIDGEVSEMKEAEEMLKTAMYAVLVSGDALRGSTAAKVVEILSPIQAVRFIAEAMDFQLRIRRWGKQRASTSIANGVA